MSSLKDIYIKDGNVLHGVDAKKERDKKRVEEIKQELRRNTVRSVTLRENGGQEEPASNKELPHSQSITDQLESKLMELPINCIEKQRNHLTPGITASSPQMPTEPSDNKMPLLSTQENAPLGSCGTAENGSLQETTSILGSDWNSDVISSDSISEDNSDSDILEINDEEGMGTVNIYDSAEDSATSSKGIDSDSSADVVDSNHDVDDLDMNLSNPVQNKMSPKVFSIEKECMSIRRRKNLKKKISASKGKSVKLSALGIDVKDQNQSSIGVKSSADASAKLAVKGASTSTGIVTTTGIDSNVSIDVEASAVAVKGSAGNVSLSGIKPSANLSAKVCATGLEAKVADVSVTGAHLAGSVSANALITGLKGEAATARVNAVDAGANASASASAVGASVKLGTMQASGLQASAQLSAMASATGASIQAGTAKFTGAQSTASASASASVTGAAINAGNIDAAGARFKKSAEAKAGMTGVELNAAQAKLTGYEQKVGASARAGLTKAQVSVGKAEVTGASKEMSAQASASAVGSQMSVGQASVMGIKSGAQASASADTKGAHLQAATVNAVGLDSTMTATASARVDAASLKVGNVNVQGMEGAGVQASAEGGLGLDAFNVNVGGPTSKLGITATSKFQFGNVNFRMGAPNIGIGPSLNIGLPFGGAGGGSKEAKGGVRSCKGNFGKGGNEKESRGSYGEFEKGKTDNEGSTDEYNDGTFDSDFGFSGRNFPGNRYSSGVTRGPVGYQGDCYGDFSHSSNTDSSGNYGASGSNYGASGSTGGASGSTGGASGSTGGASGSTGCASGHTSGSTGGTSGINYGKCGDDIHIGGGNTGSLVDYSGFGNTDGGGIPKSGSSGVSSAGSTMYGRGGGDTNRGGSYCSGNSGGYGSSRGGGDTNRGGSYCSGNSGGCGSSKTRSGGASNRHGGGGGSTQDSHGGLKLSLSTSASAGGNKAGFKTNHRLASSGVPSLGSSHRKSSTSADTNRAGTTGSLTSGSSFGHRNGADAPLSHPCTSVEDMSVSTEGSLGNNRNSNGISGLVTSDQDTSSKGKTSDQYTAWGVGTTCRRAHTDNSNHNFSEDFRVSAHNEPSNLFDELLYPQPLVRSTAEGPSIGIGFSKSLTSSTKVEDERLAGEISSELHAFNESTKVQDNHMKKKVVKSETNSLTLASVKEYIKKRKEHSSSQGEGGRGTEGASGQRENLGALSDGEESEEPKEKPFGAQKNIHTLGCFQHGGKKITKKGNICSFSD